VQIPSQLDISKCLAVLHFIGRSQYVIKIRSITTMSTQINRQFLAASLVIGSALSFISPAFAGTTDTLTIKGTVTTTLSLAVAGTTGAGSAAALELGTTGEKIVKIADLTMSTNNEQGLLLTVTSANSGSLVKAGGTSISFLLNAVNDAATAPATGDFSAGSGATYTTGSTAAGDANKDLYMKYTPATLQDPGEYTDTLTLTVTDK
jgi:hypothetical protein